MGDVPRVSVLMPVRDGERFVREAVESILDQTFQDFELLIVDDGSTDATPSILLEFTDPRVVRLRQDRAGLIAALNRGLDLARGEYFARMDADDIALPRRLERQVKFLDDNPEVGILGAAVRQMDEAGRDGGLRIVPGSDLEIRWTCLLTTPFVHPTVVVRRELLCRHGLRYDPAFPAVEDYRLWTLLLEHARGANLAEPLLRYREHASSVTGLHRQEQLRQHDRVALQAIAMRLPGKPLSEEQVTGLRRAFVGASGAEPRPAADRAELASLWLDLLERFLGGQAGEQEEEALRRREALRAARLVLRPPLPPGWGRVALRSMRMSPGLPLSLLAAVTKGLGRRMGRWAA